MPRKRMISPEIWHSADFAKLSNLAKLLFIGMFSNADDEGRGYADAVYIKSIILPRDKKTRDTDIESSLDEIADHMSVLFYKNGDDEYYELTNWTLWQKVDKPQKSRLPAYDESNSVIIRGTFGEGSANNRGTVPPNRIEKNIKEYEDNNYSSEQEAHEPPVITLPLNDKTEFEVYNSDVVEWSGIYPAVDVMQELRNMLGWLNSNPKKRKTKAGIRKFINGWLCREQDKGKTQKGNSYSDYEIYHDNYNHEELEKLTRRGIET